jgi:hypothetical protein
VINSDDFDFSQTLRIARGAQSHSAIRKCSLRLDRYHLDQIMYRRPARDHRVGIKIHLAEGRRLIDCSVRSNPMRRVLAVRRLTKSGPRRVERTFRLHTNQLIAPTCTAAVQHVPKLADGRSSLIDPDRGVIACLGELSKNGRILPRPQRSRGSDNRDRSVLCCPRFVVWCQNRRKFFATVEVLPGKRIKFGTQMTSASSDQWTLPRQTCRGF